MEDVSYCCGKFGFINTDGYAYITNEEGFLIKRIYVGKDYDEAITIVSNGFVACGERCAFFNFKGKKLWDVDVKYVVNGPAYYNGYWYIADARAADTFPQKTLLVVKDGKIVNIINHHEYEWDVAVCDKYLAVSAENHIYLYDLSDPANPREIWKVGEYADFIGSFKHVQQVSFSPDCKYIAFVGTLLSIRGGKPIIRIYDAKGDLVLEKGFDSRVKSVAWWKDRIAVGLENGMIYVYKVESGSQASTAQSSTPMCSPTTISAVSTVTSVRTVAQPK